MGGRIYVNGGRVEEAREVVGAFHEQLCELRVLDPACGTGNFLDVTLDAVERLEAVVLLLLAELGDTQAFLLSDRVVAVKGALDRAGQPLGVEEVARGFKGARRSDVEALLDSLAAIGTAAVLESPGGRRWVRV